MKWMTLASICAAAAVLAACEAGGRAETVAFQNIGAPEAAKSAFQTYGCVACHVIPGVRGARGLAGPPLLHWSERRFIAGQIPNRPERLTQFLMNPHSVRADSAMPNLDVTEEDARNMAAYLFTLH
jgi:mono/diheme cytochrome c family protein